jgi:hypothetical protein
MNAIILKGAALRQPPLPHSGPRVKTIAHPWSNATEHSVLYSTVQYFDQELHWTVPLWILVGKYGSFGATQCRPSSNVYPQNEGNVLLRNVCNHTVKLGLHQGESLSRA